MSQTPRQPPSPPEFPAIYFQPIFTPFFASDTAIAAATTIRFQSRFFLRFFAIASHAITLASSMRCQMPLHGYARPPPPAPCRERRAMKAAYAENAPSAESQRDAALPLRRHFRHWLSSIFAAYASAMPLSTRRRCRDVSAGAGIFFAAAAAGYRRFAAATHSRYTPLLFLLFFAFFALLLIR